MFSFELTKRYSVNSLRGYFTLNGALQRLLAGSGLVARVTESGQISIQADTNSQLSSSPTITRPPSAAKLVAIKPTIAQPKTVEAISIVGSRVSRRSLDNFSVPVDILSKQSLKNTGQIEVGRMLQAVAPSFNFSTSAVSDGTDVLRPATLRGLGLDQTLVLVNGKRRHQASLIHINTSVGRGSAGTDMNAIPATAIKRIEVLRDGAAAQYGSDAIAGVINIVLNDEVDQGHIGLNYGQYAQGDGKSTNLDISNGFALGDTGYINGSINYRQRDPTNRAGAYGTCQYYDCIELDDGIYIAGDPRELTANRNPFRIGDAKSQQLGLVLNVAYPIDNGEVYGFVTYSNRDNQSATFFRHHANTAANPKLQDGEVTIIEGFLPKINSDINDISYSIGLKHALDMDSAIELSYTYGQNTIDYTTSDTINASFVNALQYTSDLSTDMIRAQVPREAAAYGLGLALQTINIDYTTQFKYGALAIGSEIRTDWYDVIPGDEYSYTDYDTTNGQSLYAIDSNSGTQGFGGISSNGEVNESRDVFSLYADVQYDINQYIEINGAVRYDNYQGFGNSTNFKLSGSWAVNNNISLRGAASSGFRAPSMQQLYFSNISTQFIDNPNDSLDDQIAVQVGTFNNSSVLAKSIGIDQLAEERSQNFSLGTMIQLAENVNLTVDLYKIDIEDRIVISNQIGYGLSNNLDNSLMNAGAGAAQFFFNGADTQTKGMDIIATWKPSISSGSLDFTLAVNVTKTDVVGVLIPPNSLLGEIMKDNVFSAQDISIIEEWQPQNRISLNTRYTTDKLSLSLNINRYGEYTITDGGRQTYGAELLTGIRLNYQLTHALSLNIGGNNIFDVYPDKNKIGNSAAGTVIDNQGNIVVSSDGVFVYSRRSAPFGFNGAYFYAGIEYSF